MKTIHITCLALSVLLTACGISSYDNYDAPDSELSGNIVYQQDPINVSYDNVTFELWQSGFGKETPINVTVAQDGSFSAVLFDGDYKLVIPSGQGPFVSMTNQETNSDTVLVKVDGNTSLDVEVMPYYMIRNAGFSISDSTVTANFGAEQIISDSDGGKDIENVSLYLSKTQFVDSRTSVSTQTMSGSDISDMSNISLSTDVPELTPTQGYIFARVGVKIVDVEDQLYSTVKKIQLN